jgi:hypothetical protein
MRPLQPMESNPRFKTLHPASPNERIIALERRRRYGYRRVTGMATMLPNISTSDGRLRRCFDKLDQKLKPWVEEAKFAA